jgi:hypothetical protein
MLAPNKASAGSQQDDLDSLAGTIRTSIQASIRAAGEFLDHAMAAGETLITAKPKVRHGNWLNFLATCNLSADQAEKYMTVARGRAELAADSARGRNLSLAAALRFLKGKSPRPTTATTHAASATCRLLRSIGFSLMRAVRQSMI